MALQDILAAITAQADEHITRERAAHQKRLTALREESERIIAGKKQEIAQQKEDKKAQLRAKAETHAAMLKRNAQLEKKRALLDDLYTLVVEKLAALPAKESEALLRSLLKEVEGKGTIHPAEAHADLLKKIAPSEQFTLGTPTKASGGFVFVSERQEQDCTYENLVQEYLRPHTEVSASRQLFSS